MHMTRTPEELLQMRFGGATVAENIKRTVESGELITNEDGTLELPPSPNNQAVNWMYVANGPSLGCDFLFEMVFRKVYKKTAVPYGCRECYKVKVAPRTLRE